MQASLRKVLIDSHVAAIAIAILLFSSLCAAGMALWGSAYGVLSFLATHAAGKAPLAHLNLDDATRYILSEELANLPVILSTFAEALADMLAAYLLSRWAYGVGPLRTLSSYRDKLPRKTHA